MSYRIIEWARKQPTPDYTCRYVLLELAYFANHETRLCCPSLATLCDATQIKKKDTIRAATDRLIASGLLSKRHERGEQGQIVRTLYFFREDAYMYEVGRVSPDTAQVSPQIGQVSPEKVQGVSPEKGRNREIEQGNEQVNISCQNSSEISLNPSPEEEGKPKNGIYPKTVVPKTVLEPTNNQPLTNQLTNTQEIFEEIVREFTVRCSDLPKVTKVSDSRKRVINARLKDVGMEKLLSIFDKVHKSDWLCGRKTEWRANFDWVMKKENFQKIEEGNYDNRDVKPNLGKKINGQTQLLTVQERKDANDWGLW